MGSQFIGNLYTKLSFLAALFEKTNTTFLQIPENEKSVLVQSTKNSDASHFIFTHPNLSDEQTQEYSSSSKFISIIQELTRVITKCTHTPYFMRSRINDSAKDIVKICTHFAGTTEADQIAALENFYIQIHLSLLQIQTIGLATTYQQTDLLKSCIPQIESGSFSLEAPQEKNILLTVIEKYQHYGIKEWDQLRQLIEQAVSIDKPIATSEEIVKAGEFHFPYFLRRVIQDDFSTSHKMFYKDHTSYTNDKKTPDIITYHLKKYLGTEFSTDLFTSVALNADQFFLEATKLYENNTIDAEKDKSNNIWYFSKLPHYYPKIYKHAFAYFDNFIKDNMRSDRFNILGKREKELMADWENTLEKFPAVLQNDWAVFLNAIKGLRHELQEEYIKWNKSVLLAVNEFIYLKINCKVTDTEILTAIAYAHQISNSEDATGLTQVACNMLINKLINYNLFAIRDQSLPQFMPATLTGGLAFREYECLSSINTPDGPIKSLQNLSNPIAVVITDFTFKDNPETNKVITIKNMEMRIPHFVPQFFKNFLQDGVTDPAFSETATFNEYEEFLGILAHLTIKKFIPLDIFSVLMRIVFKRLKSLNTITDDQTAKDREEFLHPYFYQLGNWLCLNKEDVLKNIESMLSSYNQTLEELQTANGDRMLLKSGKEEVDNADNDSHIRIRKKNKNTQSTFAAHHIAIFNKLKSCYMNIISLNLSDYSGLTIEHLQWIAKHFKTLKELNLSRTNIQYLESKTGERLILPSLTVLLMSDCPALMGVKIEAHELQILDLSACKKLELANCSFDIPQIKELFLPEKEMDPDILYKSLLQTESNVENIDKQLKAIRPIGYAIVYVRTINAPLANAMYYLYKTNPNLFNHLLQKETIYNNLNWYDYALACLIETKYDPIHLREFVRYGANPVKRISFGIMAHVFDVSSDNLSAIERATIKGNKQIVKSLCFIARAMQNQRKYHHAVLDDQPLGLKQLLILPEAHSSNELEYRISLYSALGHAIEQKNVDIVEILLSEIQYIENEVENTNNNRWNKAFLQEIIKYQFLTAETSALKNWLLQLMQKHELTIKQRQSLLNNLDKNEWNSKNISSLLDASFRAALFYAMQLHATEVVKKLLTIHTWHNDALEEAGKLATSLNFSDIVSLIAQHQINQNSTPLVVTSAPALADLDIPNKIFISNQIVNYAQSGDLKVLKSLISLLKTLKMDHETLKNILYLSITIALINGHLEVIQYLCVEIENFIPIKQPIISDNNFLLIALEGSHLHIYQYLKEVWHLNLADEMHKAVISGKVEFVRYLCLTENEAIDSIYENNTPLDLAIQQGANEIRDCLLFYGASVSLLTSQTKDKAIQSTFYGSLWQTKQTPVSNDNYAITYTSGLM